MSKEKPMLESEITELRKSDVRQSEEKRVQFRFNKEKGEFEEIPLGAECSVCFILTNQYYHWTVYSNNWRLQNFDRFT